MSATSVQLSQPIWPSVIDRYRRNRNWRSYPKEWIFRNFPPSGKTCLDFGCGTGEITAQLALLGASRVFAVDVTPGLLEMTRRQVELDGVSDRVCTICADLTAIEPQPVDMVVANAVLHHVPDRLQEIIPVIFRWLRPGGIFIYHEPACYLPGLEWLRSHSGIPYDDLDPGERKLGPQDLKLIESYFDSCERIHFNLLARFARIFPSFAHQFRSADALLRYVPGSWLLSGSVLGVCRKSDGGQQAIAPAADYQNAA